jgi:hypothetical protein
MKIDGQKLIEQLYALDMSGSEVSWFVHQYSETHDLDLIWRRACFGSKALLLARLGVAGMSINAPVLFSKVKASGSITMPLIRQPPFYEKSYVGRYTTLSGNSQVNKFIK